MSSWVVQSEFMCLLERASFWHDHACDGLTRACWPGELSPALAWVLCIGLAAAGLSITAANFGREITILYASGLCLGTIYSVPPFRCLTQSSCHREPWTE